MAPNVAAIEYWAKKLLGIPKPLDTPQSRLSRGESVASTVRATTNFSYNFLNFSLSRITLSPMLSATQP
jgi:hypothetical protein